MQKVTRFYAPGLDGLWRDPAGALREMIPLVQGKDYDALLVENEQLRSGKRETPTMPAALSRSHLRGLQEIATALGLRDPSRAEIVAAVKQLQNRAHALTEQLRAAHAFVENAEAFGPAATSGILQCGDARWNIDESKELLGLPPQTAPAQTKEQ